MFERIDGALKFRNLDAEIFFDDIFDIANTPEEIDWIFNKLLQTAYFEALEIGKDKGFSEIEDVVDFNL